MVRRDHESAGRGLNAAASRSAGLAPDATGAVVAPVLLVVQAGEVPRRGPRPPDQQQVQWGAENGGQDNAKRALSVTPDQLS